MKLFERKALVYRSKDGEDWEKARALLREAGIAFADYETDEPTGACCGAKIDIRKAGRDVEVPDRIFRIEVAAKDKAAAEGVLEGKVLPVKSYGFSL